MTEKSFYFDTSIWLDIYEKRGNNGEQARKLFKRFIKEDNLIFYSDLHIAEFKRLGYSKQEIDIILGIAKPDNLRKAHVYKKQIEDARKLARQRNIPEADVLHAMLAKDNAAQFISRDKHFTKLKDIAITKPPEEFN